MAVRFEHAIEIDRPRATVHAFLCSLESLAPLHPLIESITPLPAEAARPDARRYRVVDRIAFGPFKLRAEYTAALEPIDAGEVRGEAWQVPGVHLITRYRLEEREQRTRLVETCTVEAPFGLRRFVARLASDAHRATLERMKLLLER